MVGAQVLQEHWLLCVNWQKSPSSWRRLLAITWKCVLVKAKEERLSCTGWVLWDSSMHVGRGREGEKEQPWTWNLAAVILISAVCSCCVLELTKILWMASPLVRFSNFYGTEIPVYKSCVLELTLCMCKGVYQVWSGQLLVKRKPSGPNSFHMSRLSRRPSLLVKPAVLVKNRVPPHQRGEIFQGYALPRASSDTDFFYSVSFWCAAEMTWVTPPPNAGSRERIGLMRQSDLWQQMRSLLGHFCT